MANATVLSQPQTLQYTSRSDIRRAIHHIVRRRTTQQQLDGYAMARTQLSKTNRRRSIKKSCLFEDILYKYADAMAEYQDLSTLEERVYKAGQAVYISTRRQEM